MRAATPLALFLASTILGCAHHEPVFVWEGWVECPTCDMHGQISLVIPATGLRIEGGAFFYSDPEKERIHEQCRPKSLSEFISREDELPKEKDRKWFVTPECSLAGCRFTLESDRQRLQLPLRRLRFGVIPGECPPR